jgi:hypothetical protein
MDVRSTTRVALSPARKRSRRRIGEPRGERPRAPETTPGWRVLRGAVVGTAATALAVAGHQAADGAVPPVGAVATAAVLVGTASVALSRLRWSLPRLVGLLLVTQPALHALFVWARPDTGATTAGLAHAHAHATVHAQAVEQAAPLLPSGPAMTLAHVLAAAATAVLLSRGESWLCGVLDALALRVVRLLRGFLGVYGVRAQPVPVRVQLPHRRREPAQAWSPRGPPC